MSKRIEMLTDQKNHANRPRRKAPQIVRRCRAVCDVATVWIEDLAHEVSRQERKRNDTDLWALSRSVDGARKTPVHGGTPDAEGRAGSANTIQSCPRSFADPPPERSSASCFHRPENAGPIRRENWEGVVGSYGSACFSGGSTFIGRRIRAQRSVCAVRKSSKCSW